MDTLHLGTIEHLPFIQQYPYFESFEDGANGWRAINDQNGAENGSWAWGVPNKRFIDHAPDGDNAWVTGGLDNAPYNSNEDSWILSPCFDFSTLCAPRMDFQIWWQTEYEWDGLVLESSIDGGMTWQLIGNVNDPTNWFNTTNISAAPAGQSIGWSGGGVVSPNGSNGWVLAVHELDNLAGNAQVQFRFFICFGWRIRRRWYWLRCYSCV